MDQDNPAVRYDPTYATRLPGLLRFTEALLNILGLICVFATDNEYELLSSTGIWYKTVASSGFLLSGIFLAFYVFRIVHGFHRIPWLKIEFAFCGIWMIGNLVVGIFMTDHAGHSGTLCAATVFAFGAMLVYGVNGFLKYTSWKTYAVILAAVG